ncbi:MAG: hypothetical protein H7039_06795 [Bryobacteraceae bacterium]|nr:hypothetical protein [Bryobacteraceae bacterium]
MQRARPLNLVGHCCALITERHHAIWELPEVPAFGSQRRTVLAVKGTLRRANNGEPLTAPGRYE